MGLHVKKKPSIKTLIIATTAIAFLLMFIFLYVVFFLSMQKQLMDRENDNMRSQVNMAENVFDSSVNYLPRITRDWSSWDYTYDYVNGDYDEFLDDYLTDYPFQLFRINFITVLDSDNKIVYERFYDFNELKFIQRYPDLSDLYETIGPATMATFQEDEVLDLKDTTQIGMSGFINHNGMIYYMSSFPIIRSDETGPCVGSFIFGRIIDDKELQYLTANSGLHFYVEYLDDVDLSDEQKNELFQQGDLVAIKDQNVVSYTIMNDIFGNGNLLVSFSSPRSIYESGINYISTVILVIALCCGFVLIIMLNLLNRIVVRPLGELVNDVNEINLETISATIEQNGRNLELDNLTIAVNSMLTRIKTSRDIIEKNNEELFARANYDMLTGLSNRFMAISYLEEEIVKAKRDSIGLTVYYFDLDRFKFINDTLGHKAGDGFIVELAKRLKECFDGDAFVSRMGGDEFLIVATNLNDRAQMQLFAERIFSVFKEHFDLKHRTMQIGASIGSSSYPADGQDAETLIKTAEIAMYRAKDMGRGAYVTYHHELQMAVQQRIYIENKLRTAVNDNCKEFMAYLQPKLNIATGEILSCEALMRWVSPEGVISPMSFIPQAEESGLIIPLSWWMIRECCRIQKGFMRKGINCSVAVNVSAQVLLHKDFIAMVKSAVEEFGVQYIKLDIEIVEQTLVDDIDKINVVFQALHSLGVEISVDDFGTGYSSLSYLNKMSVDRIKIDRSFISKLSTSEEDQAIVRAILAMAKSLHMVVTAEGVENKDQYAFLKAAECEEIQGYLISKPLPEDEFIKFVKGWKPDNAEF